MPLLMLKTSDKWSGSSMVSSTECLPDPDLLSLVKGIGLAARLQWLVIFSLTYQSYASAVVPHLDRPPSFLPRVGGVREST